MKKGIIAALVIMMLAGSALAAKGELKETFSDDKQLIQEDYFDDQGKLVVGEQ